MISSFVRDENLSKFILPATISDANILLKYDLMDERVQYLIRTDAALGKLIRYIGTSELVIEKDGFRCLVKYIIGQQISDKARETIWQRICNTLDHVTPDAILLTVAYSVQLEKYLATSLVDGGVSKSYIHWMVRLIVPSPFDVQHIQEKNMV